MAVVGSAHAWYRRRMNSLGGDRPPVTVEFGEMHAEFTDRLLPSVDFERIAKDAVTGGLF